MSMSDLTPPYAIEIVNYQINDDVDAEAFEAICRTVGEEFSSQHRDLLDASSAAATRASG